MSSLLLLLFVGCTDVPPIDSDPVEECTDPGDIDLFRFEMVSQTCMWLVSDCEVRPETHYDACFSTLLTATIEFVDDANCLDWCSARAYAESIRGESCEALDGLGYAEADSYAGDRITQHFYTCGSPNYEPSGP